MSVSIRKGIGGRICSLCMAAALFSLVIVPMIFMFGEMTVKDIADVFTGTKLLPALKNTLVLTAAATVISVVLAYALAWSLERADIKYRSVFSVIAALPMLIPSISHGMGLVILLGNNGLLTRLFSFDGGIYGPVGIIAGSVMYAFPVCFIMLSDALRYEDRTPYEAAEVLGIGAWRRFTRITLPYLRKPLIAAVFSSFSLIATDYGVPLMIGGKTKTLSLLMYEEVIGQLKFGRGCVYGALLLIPAVIAFLADILGKDGRQTAFIKRNERPSSPLFSKIFAYALCGIICAAVLLPIAAFLVLAFAKNYPTDMGFTLDNIKNTMIGRRGGGFLINSLVIAAVTASLGTAIGFVCSYLTARMRGGVSRLLHLLVLTFMAIPGIVLGLSYVITFSGGALEGTLAILIMVNTAHFLSSPYLMMYNSFCKMNGSLEAVGETLGIGKLRLIRDVFLPQSLGTLAEMFSYLFVNCMMTISAVSFLASTDTRPISLMINQFEQQMQYEFAAVVSLAILAVNLALKVIIAAYKKRLREVKKIKI